MVLARPMNTRPKSRFARLMLATLVGTLALGGMAATVARADSHFDKTATNQAFGAPKLTLDDAIRTAQAAGPGMVTGEASELTALEGGKETLLQAITAAEGQGGRAPSAE